MILQVATFLSWADVAPSRRPPFVPEIAARVVHPLVVASGRGGDRDTLEAKIDRALVAEYGAWAAGWRWSASEPGGGGPVNGWCCARDSLFQREDKDPRDSTDRVVGAITDWSAFLDRLEAIYAELPTGQWLVQDLEVAAARLLPLIVERTHAEDAWYSTLTKVLVWYAEARGLDAGVVGPAIDSVIRGRFHSWCEPSPEAATAAWAELGPRITTALSSKVVTDATSAWLEQRASAFANAFVTKKRPPLAHDGHRRFIVGPERERDPRRADAMEVALDACRASAAANEPLALALLERWQSIVLGAPAEFRTTDAFAKGGRERYPFTEGTRARFEACLREANDVRTPIPVRAARAYLDVCFFHPFEDGNARAARLALDHVLTRSGLGLCSVEPLFVVARSAADSRGAWCLAYLVDYLAGSTV